MNMYKVTFTCKGYVASVQYVRAKTEAEAIESARMEMVNKWTAVRAELV